MNSTSYASFGCVARNQTGANRGIADCGRRFVEVVTATNRVVGRTPTGSGLVPRVTFIPRRESARLLEIPTLRQDIVQSQDPIVKIFYLRMSDRCASGRHRGFDSPQNASLPNLVQLDLQADRKVTVRFARPSSDPLPPSKKRAGLRSRSVGNSNTRDRF